MSAYGEFLRGLVDDPKSVSAPTPSGPALSAAMAAKVDLKRPGLIVELGAGTGVITQALTARGIAQRRLLLIESGEFFCKLLARRFPGAEVVTGDAFRFEDYVPHGARIAAIVCGVPLLNFPPAQRESLIARGLDAQGPGGRFIQLSYGWKPAVPPAPDLAVKKSLVWRNLPPAHVWTYYRPN
jgi:phosphatidylethanolamine/phosphatidyl-N-methylethanolamine N-methyltransferase